MSSAKTEPKQSALKQPEKSWNEKLNQAKLALKWCKKLWDKWKSLFMQILLITIIAMIVYIIVCSDFGKNLGQMFRVDFLKDNGFRILIICFLFTVALSLFWNWFKSQSRAAQILLTVLIEILAVIFVWHDFGKYFNEEPWVTFLKGNGIWTLATLLLSAPVAFVVWHSRDQNTLIQLESQRKDINLKEFQKIAEWVSGLHLVEDKITKKTKTSHKGESAKQNEETETVHEYGQAGENRHIRTPSREDGTAGLQVAAVYMLRPFFCGEHGDGFREPALNLLTATWLALFKPIEQQFKEAADANEQQRIIGEIVASPLAVALNQVLLADGGKPLSRFPHIFPNLYLPGLQLNQPGVDQQTKALWQGKDCSGIQLWGADLQGINLQGANLQRAELQAANLMEANLQRAQLQFAKLQRALLFNVRLQVAQLRFAKLQGTDLQLAKLQGAQLQEARLHEAKLCNAQLQGAKLEGANLQGAELQGANLQGAELQGVDLQGSKLEAADLPLSELQGAVVVLDTDIDHSKELQNVADLIVLVTEQPEKIYELTFQRKDAGIDVTSIQPINLEATRKKNPTWQIEAQAIDAA